jgi:hypothetical protein
MSKLPFLKHANHFSAVLSAVESYPKMAQMLWAASAAFEASVELVKTKVLEMFIFLKFLVLNISHL